MIGTDTLIDAFKKAGAPLPDDAVNNPADLARFALDGIEAGETEILDRQAVAAKKTLAGRPSTVDLTTIAVP